MNFMLSMNCMTNRIDIMINVMTGPVQWSE